MNPNIPPLLRREVRQDLIIKIDKRPQQMSTRPGIPRIILRRQAALSEVDTHALRARREAAADVLDALGDHVLDELGFGVAGDLAVQGVQEVHHGRGDDGLLHGLGGVGLGELEVVVREGLVPEGSPDQAGQLAVVPVVEDGEVLAVGFHVLHEAGPAERAILGSAI